MKKKSSSQPIAAAGKKSDALSLRVDPVVRFGLELAARAGKRTVSGVIESAIETLFENTRLKLPDGEEFSLRHIVSAIWSPNEVERLVGLGIALPNLLDFDESRMWKVITETRDLWNHPRQRTRVNFDWETAVNSWEKLRPMIVENAQKPVVKGLTDAQIAEVSS